MICEKLTISVDCTPVGIDGQLQSSITTHILQDGDADAPKGRRPAVVICPGGGYTNTSTREADTVAARFNKRGCSAFVLWYTCLKLPFPSHLLTAAKTVAFIREHADEWQIDPNNITICGFSAGGHLAGSLGTLWNRDYVKDALGYYNEEHKPNGMILCYPVITSGKFAHRASFDYLLLDRKSDELLEETSLEKQVSSDTVPAFIWHTFADSVVPVENALLMASALSAHKIRSELHMFPYGNHGLSTATAEVGGGPEECAAWLDMAVRWMTQLNETTN